MYIFLSMITELEILLKIYQLKIHKTLENLWMKINRVLILPKKLQPHQEKRFNFKLDLGLSFFALSMEYKKNQLNEILFLVKRGFSYGDIRSMPIYVRRYYVETLIEI